MTSFENKLREHNYKVFISSTAENPVVFVADIHTETVGERNKKLLQDLLREDDLLFMEGTLSGIQYPDLQQQFFEAARISPKMQEDMRRKYEETKKIATPQKKEFLCDILGSEEDIILTTCAAAKNVFDDITKEPEEIIKALGQEVLKKALVKALSVIDTATHYRNHAIAYTLAKKYGENPTRRMYHVIGAQHVLPPETFAKTAVALAMAFDYTTGQLGKLLSVQNVPHIVIGPTNFLEECQAAVTC